MTILRKLILLNSPKEFIVRVYVLIECEGLLDLHNNEGVFMEAPEKSYHLCIFENMLSDLEEEEILKSKLNEEMLQFGQLKKWMLVDVDGVMKGNPYIKSEKDLD